MRVILMQDVLHTGQRGEVVDVKPGLARNYLIPQGLALEATAGNQKYFEQQKKKIDSGWGRAKRFTAR
jgi:large subunit ribosomal protein L9